MQLLFGYARVSALLLGLNNGETAASYLCSRECGDVEGSNYAIIKTQARDGHTVSPSPAPKTAYARKPRARASRAVFSKKTVVVAVFLFSMKGKKMLWVAN